MLEILDREDSMEYNLVDVLMIVLIGMCVVTGIKKGFIMSLFNLIGIILAFFISKEYYHLIMNFLIKNTKLETSVSEFVSGKISNVVADIGESVSMADLFKGFDKLPFDMKRICRILYLFYAQRYLEYA